MQILKITMMHSKQHVTVFDTDLTEEAFFELIKPHLTQKDEHEGMSLALASELTTWPLE